MTTTNEPARAERDALGIVEVPAGAMYGAHTVRALANTLPSGPRLSDWRQLVCAFAHVKAGAALANADLDVLDRRVARAIVEAADEVINGKWVTALALPIMQGGGGTSTNMAVNEVLANRAAQLLGGQPGRYEAVHPLDHVNRSQSTNDVYPTALHIAIVQTSEQTVNGLEAVASVLDDCAAAVGDAKRLGRTCLQDALPVPIASYHRAQAGAVRRALTGIRDATTELLAIPLGATAVGTGVGAPRGYSERALEHLVRRTDLPLRPAADRFDALAHADPLLGVAAATCTAAICLAKIASDLRLLSSGPVGGIGEVLLPAVQVGSSIMPGKVNPVIPELVIQASFGIRGSASVVESAVAAGELDLNIMGPVAARHLFQALTELADVATLFAERCLAGLRWNDAAVAEHLAGSLEGDVLRAVAAGHDALA